MFFFLLLSVILLQVDCIPPPAPQAIQVVGIVSRQVTIIVTPAENAARSTTYEVTFVSQISGVPDVGPIPISGSFYTAPGLVPDTEYIVQLVAVRENERSSPVNATITTTPDVPSGPPQNIRTTSKTPTSLTLAWDEPAPSKINDRHGPTSYVVILGNDRVGTPTGRSFTLTQLSPGQSYTIRILAVNAQGEAPARFAASYTDTTADGIPGPPSFLVVLPLFTVTFLVWSPPSPSVGTITAYEIRYMADGQEISTGTETDTVLKTVRNLSPHVGTRHSVSIRAQTSAGWGPNSTPLEFDFNPIVSVIPSQHDCNTVSLSFQVQPLPDFSGARLNSLTIKYHKKVGSDLTKTIVVDLSNNTMDGTVCAADELEKGIKYEFDYNVDVTLFGNFRLPADFPPDFDFEIPSDCATPETSCGIVIPFGGAKRNDSVIGDPLFTIPLQTQVSIGGSIRESVSLCFEFNGRANKQYSLISDQCTFVNANYAPASADPTLHIISEISIRTEANSSCHDVHVLMEGCRVTLNGRNFLGSYQANGIALNTLRNRVRISTDNCISGRELVMWIVCDEQTEIHNLRFVVSRGAAILPIGHGLIGQFWSIPVDLVPYHGPYGMFSTVPDDIQAFNLTFMPEDKPPRSVIAELARKTWDNTKKYCLYAGNGMGGPIVEAPPKFAFGSVIEDKHDSYEVASLFEHDFKYSKFVAKC